MNCQFEHEIGLSRCLTHKLDSSLCPFGAKREQAKKNLIALKVVVRAPWFDEVQAYESLAEEGFCKAEDDRFIVDHNASTRRYTLIVTSRLNPIPQQG